jgi:hypothetical protein
VHLGIITIAKAAKQVHTKTLLMSNTVQNEILDVQRFRYLVISPAFDCQGPGISLLADQGAPGRRRNGALSAEG